MDWVLFKKMKNLDNYLFGIMKQYLQSKTLDVCMPAVTALGNLGLIWILISIYLYSNKDLRTMGRIVIFTLVISTIIGEGLLKHIFRRSRPCLEEEDTELLISKPMSYSFPSGHALSSFAEAGVLSLYFSQYAIIFFTIASLIALSRVYLLVHYPTDVIAGMVFGLLCSKLVLFLFHQGLLEKFIGFKAVISHII